MAYTRTDKRHIGGSGVIHEQLIKYAEAQLKQLGCKNIKLNCCVIKRTQNKIDLYAEKDGLKIGVECFARHGSRNNHKEKLRKYRGLLDILIFCVPERERKKAILYNLWEVPKEYFKKGIVGKKKGQGRL